MGTVAFCFFKIWLLLVLRLSLIFRTDLLAILVAPLLWFQIEKENKWKSCLRYLQFEKKEVMCSKLWGFLKSKSETIFFSLRSRSLHPVWKFQGNGRIVIFTSEDVGWNILERKYLGKENKFCGHILVPICLYLPVSRLYVQLLHIRITSLLGLWEKGFWVEEIFQYASLQTLWLKNQCRVP